MTLDDRFLRPVQRPRITLDTELIGYKRGIRHGITIGTIVTFTLFVLALIAR